MSIVPSSNQAKQIAQHLADLSADLAAEQEDGHQRLKRGVGVGMVDAFVRRQIGGGVGAQGDEGLQVVADDFGGDILDYGLLGQSGDVFQIEPVLEPFERLLNLPAI